MQSNRPDWVQCATCTTVYAPKLIGGRSCPRCGDTHWFPAAIPNDPKPPAEQAAYARLM